MSAFTVNQNTSSIQYNEWPSNVPIKCKDSDWKFWKDGIILEKSHNKIDGTKVITKAFHYTDSRGNPTFRSLSPMMEFRFM